jgi:hypothetical protein
MADWGSSSNRSNIFTFYCLVVTFTPSQLFQSTTCCSSFVSVMSEDVLGGFANPIATLHVSPWRDLARATFGGLTTGKRTNVVRYNFCRALSIGRTTKPLFAVRFSKDARQTLTHVFYFFYHAFSARRTANTNPCSLTSIAASRY